MPRDIIVGRKLLIDGLGIDVVLVWACLGHHFGDEETDLSEPFFLSKKLIVSSLWSLVSFICRLYIDRYWAKEQKSVPCRIRFRIVDECV